MQMLALPSTGKALNCYLGLMEVLKNSVSCCGGELCKLVCQLLLSALTPISPSLSSALPLDTSGVLVHHVSDEGRHWLRQYGVWLGEQLLAPPPSLAVFSCLDTLGRVAVSSVGDP